MLRALSSLSLSRPPDVQKKKTSKGSNDRLVVPLSGVDEEIDEIDISCFDSVKRFRNIN